MKWQRFILFFLVFLVFGMAQKIPVDDWVELLKDNSNSQFKFHYFLCLQIPKLDTASRLKAATGIEKECEKGDKRLRLLGRSVNLLKPKK